MNVGKEIAVLKHMTVTELRAKYAEVFGEETRSGHKDFLVKRIAWRLQSQAEGEPSSKRRARGDKQMGYAAGLWQRHAGYCILRLARGHLGPSAGTQSEDAGVGTNDRPSGRRLTAM